MTDTSTAERNLETIRRITDAVNRGETEPFVAHFAAVHHYKDWASGLTSTDHDRLRELLHDWYHAFPDLNAEVTQTFLDGDTLAYTWVMNGTLSEARARTGLTTGATPGSRFTLHGISTVEFDTDGKITEFGDYYDALSWLRQLGMPL